MIKPGSRAVVVDVGKTYTTYYTFFDENPEISDFRDQWTFDASEEEYNKLKNQTVHVLFVGRHVHSKITKVYLISHQGHVYLIGESGLSPLSETSTIKIDTLYD